MVKIRICYGRKIKCKSPGGILFSCRPHREWNSHRRAQKMGALRAFEIFYKNEIPLTQISLRMTM